MENLEVRNRELNEKKERCIICGVFMGTGKINDSDFASLKELKALCEACGAEVVGEVYQQRDSIDARTVIGKGKVEEIRNSIELLDADLVVFDCELSGSNTRNLESELNVRVIDRSRLILDIFALRATTKEGKCQVELAQLLYTLPRLSGIGTSLSRLGGGIGTRGPGETQLETDKRHINERIINLRKELKEIEKTRETMRKQRTKSEIPSVALVGYTNAGKSSLLNAFTDSDQFVKDMLFATLDPLSKKLTLSDGRDAVITDTVGFIRKLPHKLVEAFKSTLEAAVYADVLIHVVDATDEDAPTHIKTVEHILNELEIKDKPTIIAYNKCDRLSEDDILSIKDGIPISVKSGLNLDKLLFEITEMTKKGEIEKTICVPYDKTHIISKMYDKLQVRNISYEENGQMVTVYGKEEIISYYERL